MAMAMMMEGGGGSATRDKSRSQLVGAAAWEVTLSRWKREEGCCFGNVIDRAEGVGGVGEREQAGNGQRGLVCVCASVRAQRWSAST